MKTIRRLGLAVLAALALAAFLNAAAASASQIVAEEYPNYPEATSVQSAQDPLFEFGGGFKAECSSPLLKGEIKAGTKTVTMEAVGDGSCYHTTFGSGPLKANGCTFTFETGEQLNPGGEESAPDFNGAFGVNCPEGKKLEFIMGTCVIAVSPKSGNPARYMSGEAKSGSPTVIEADAKGLTYQGSGGGGCSLYKGNTANWYPKWDLTTTNILSAQIDTRVSSSGISITGIAPTQPKFTSTAYPAWVATGPEQFSLSIPGVSPFYRCDETRLWVKLIAAVAGGAVNSEFGDCSFGASAASVKMNSCKLNLSLLNVGPPYKGTVGVTCSKEGDAIEFTSAACTVKLPAQAGHEGLGLANVGAPKYPTGVTLLTNVGGFSWTRSGTCGASSGSNGSLVGSEAVMFG